MPPAETSDAPEAADQHHAATEPPARRPEWPPVNVLFAVLLGLGGAVVGQLILSLVGLAFGADLDDPPASISILGVLVQDAAFVAAAVLMARTVAPAAPWQFGLRATRIWRAAGFLAIGYAAFIGLSALWAALLDLTGEDDRLVSDLGGDDSSFALAGIAILVCIVAPLSEELFFRGFMYPSLRGRFGIPVAVGVTGLTFGIAHVLGTDVEYLPLLALLGAGFCVLYQLTGSLWPSICAHSLNNSIALCSIQGWNWQAVPIFAGSLLVFRLLALGLKARYGPGPARIAPAGRLTS